MIGLQGFKLKDLLRASAFLLAVCTLLGALSCAGAGRESVYVIGKTRSYHRADCARVRMAYAETMNRDEAIALDYKPCPDCRPDARR
jgi:hypothetical protein